MLPESSAATSGSAKLKLVRDSFTIPQTEYAQLDQLKQRALALAHHVKKSELLRAGIAALVALDDAALLLALQAVMPIKTGRPKGAKAEVDVTGADDTVDAPGVKPKHKHKPKNGARKG